MKRSTFTVHGSRLFSFRRPPGFAYIALLVAIIIIGISLGAAGKYWSYVMLRDKEAELLFRGEQYRKAIDRYFFYGGQYPPSIEDLLKDPRSATGRRHLRQQYKDPINGEDFELIKNITTKRIIGVRSTSDKECLKQVDFPPTVLIPVSAGTYSIQLPIAPRKKASEDFSFDNKESASLNKDSADSDKESTDSEKLKYSDWLFISSHISTTQTPGTPPPRP